MEYLLDSIGDGTIGWKTVIENFYPDLDKAVKEAEKTLESVKIADEVTDVICDQCGRNMVIKYGRTANSLPARDSRTVKTRSRTWKRSA